MSQVPSPIRAVVGLVAVTVDTARTTPEKIIELPVLAVSTAMQAALRAQQRYAELTTRGDEVLGRLRGVPEEPPAWATFDDAPPAAEDTTIPPDVSAKSTRPRSAFDAVDDSDID